MSRERNPKPCRLVARFKWTAKKSRAALMLAEGYSKKEVSETLTVALRTVFYWADAMEFAEEVDRLSLMVGVANQAERLRIANCVIRQKVREGTVDTEKDLLDWLRYVQTETDESNEHIAAAFREVAASLADKREEVADREASAA